MVCNITHISYNIQLCDSVCFLACKMFIQNKIDKMERIWRKCNLDSYTPLTTRLRLYSNMSRTCVRIYMYEIVMCIHCQPLLSLLGCETETAIETGRYRSRSTVGCSQTRELKYGTRNMIGTSVLRCDKKCLSAPQSLWWVKSAGAGRNTKTWLDCFDRTPNNINRL